MPKAKWTIDSVEGQDSDPVLAGTYKLLKNFDRIIAEEDTTWEALEVVRSGLGGPRMDGVRYSDMRVFIRDFLDKWGIS